MPLLSSIGPYTNTLFFGTDRAGTTPAWYSLGQQATINATSKSSPVAVWFANSSWKQIEQNAYVGVGIKTDGTLWSWGDNTYGGLGMDNDRNKWISPPKGTVANMTHFLGIRADGTLWGMGNNASGQLGTGDTINRSSPTQVSGGGSWSQVAIGYTGTGGFTLAINSAGKLYAWGFGTQGQLGLNNTLTYSVPQAVGTSNWISIAAGVFTSLAVRADGTLWGWGTGSQGLIANGSTLNKSSPTQIGALTNWSQVTMGHSNAMALKTDGSLWVWGNNTAGQVGDNTTISRSSPVQAAVTGSFTIISSGSASSYAIMTDNTLWGWGQNTSYQLGDGTTYYKSSPTQITTTTGLGATVTLFSDVSAANLSVIARDMTGRNYYGAGVNGFGQLGVGDTLSRTTWMELGWGGPPTVKAALFSNGGLIQYNWNEYSFFCGNNNTGQLGDGTRVGQSSLTNVPAPFFGTVAARSSPTQIGYSNGWTNVYLGDSISTVFAYRNGLLWRWGLNSNGELGDNSTVNKSSPTLLSGTWDKITVGATHVLGQKGGLLYAWGNNQYGQLGLNTTINRSSPVQITATTMSLAGTISAGTNSSAAIANDGTLYHWGGINSGLTNNYSSPVQISSSTSWRAVVAMSGGGIGLNGQSLYTWGNNSTGQLGDGTTVDKSSPVQITGTWSGIGGGATTAYGIKNQTVYAWGNNAKGLIGDNSTINKSSPVLMSGLPTFKSNPSVVGGQSTATILGRV